METTTEKLDEDDYSEGNEDYVDHLDAIDKGIDTTTKMDEEDKEDEHDLNVLLGLEDIKEQPTEDNVIDQKEAASSSVQIILLSIFACIVSSNTLLCIS